MSKDKSLRFSCVRSLNTCRPSRGIARQQSSKFSSIMKKLVILKPFILTFVLLCTITLSANAQILRAEELEKYAKEQYGENWEEAAINLSQQLELDKNKAITYVQVIDATGQSKDQLYVKLNYWFTSTFNDANAVIKLNDKELGTIIAHGFVEGIAQHTGGSNRYNVSIRPVIKCDIKDEKIRVTYSVPYYSVYKLVGGGWMSILSDNTRPVPTEENWVLDECFPFVAKDKHKKTSCKALVMAHAYSNVVMDKIEEAIKNGMVGNENDNW